MTTTTRDRLAERFPEYDEVPRGAAQRRVMYAVLALYYRRDTPAVDGLPGGRLVTYADVAALAGMVRWEARGVVRDLAAAASGRPPLLDIVETPDRLSVAVVVLDPDGP